MRFNEKGVASIIFILIIVGLIGVIGFFTFQNSSLRKKTTQTQKTPAYTPLNLSTSKQTYVNEKYQFSFNYPPDLKSLELANGVVTFLPEGAYDSCEAAQGSKDFDAFESCNRAIFNFNGYQSIPSKNYQEHIKDINDSAKLSSFTDDKNRTWDTSLVFGQVYQFNAFTQINSTQIQISFQYGFDAPSEQEVLTFFNQILSTFNFGGQADTTANWKTYSDSDFSFKYPNKWTFNKYGKNGNLFSKQLMLVDPSNGNKTGIGSIIILIYDNPNQLSLKDYETEEVERLGENSQRLVFYRTSGVNTQLGNMTALLLANENCEPGKCDVYLLSLKENIYQILVRYDFVNKTSIKFSPPLNSQNKYKSEVN